MSAHFKWYPASEEVVVPWNARYSFPSQSNKAVKITPRIPPKSGSAFAPGQVIRVEFPAQGYVNPLNTTLEFDVTLYGFSTADQQIVRFQNNIQSIFSRVRLLYGATPLEDMINYNVIVRSLTEWTATNQHMTMDQTSICEGIGGTTIATDSNSTPYFGVVNTRNKYIHGVSVTNPVASNFMGGDDLGFIPQGSEVPAGITGNGSTGVTRRYQINFALGLFTQDKLIPTKFMASQLAIELTLEQPNACIYVPPTSVTAISGSPTYGVGNVNLIPEILEFDASYDSMFLAGLRDGGVPLKFSSWHTFTFSSSGANVNLLVQERSRSVKALFAVQRRQQPTFFTDSHATLYDTSVNGASTLQNYQFRIGGRYFPAAPVQCSSNVGSAYSNGAAEAYVELQKALNVVGDYRLSTNCNASRWGLQNAGGILQEYDYMHSLRQILTNGVTTVNVIEGKTNSFSGTLGSQCFGMAIDLETSNGVEISGLNAEEQSDIALIANWTQPQVTGAPQSTNGIPVAGGVPTALEVYSYYDAMIVLRENNVLELIQ